MADRGESVRAGAPEPPEAEVRWRLAAGAELEDREGGLEVRRGRTREPVPAGNAGLREVLGCLTHEGLTEEELSRRLTRSEPAGAAAALAVLLRLRCLGLIAEALVLHGTEHVRRAMGSRHCRIAPFDTAAEHVLSRFAYWRRDGTDIVLESPRSGWRVTLHSPQAVAWLHELGAGRGEEVPPEVVRFLAEAALVVPIRAGDRATDEDEPPLRTWEFHDLLFHARTRGGRHGLGLGGSRRFGEAIAPPPLRRPPSDGDRSIALPVPDADAVGPGIYRTLADRRSSRPVGADVDLESLAELLHRAAGALRVDEAGGCSWRPYPTGGAIGELAIYAVVDRCRDLEPGMYRYDGLDHVLVDLRTRDTDRRRLLRSAAGNQARDGLPAILLVLASRFARVATKYEGIAYALVLKNAGGLLQTIYLVATALGIPVCAVGGGDSLAFARATGLPEHEEGPVAEVTLG